MNPSLTEFLLARIREDEAVAEAAKREWDSDRDGGWWVGCADETQAHIVRNDPARVLAECESRQRIVEVHIKAKIVGDAAIVLLLLALPYVDHPDYRPEWTP